MNQQFSHRFISVYHSPTATSMTLCCGLVDHCTRHCVLHISPPSNILSNDKPFSWHACFTVQPIIVDEFPSLADLMQCENECTCTSQHTYKLSTVVIFTDMYLVVVLVLHRQDKMVTVLPDTETFSTPWISLCLVDVLVFPKNMETYFFNDTPWYNFFRVPPLQIFNEIL